MPVTIDGGAGVTFPDGVQQTNGVTNTGGDPRYYTARAWATFSGSSSPPVILAASNVASVTRTGTGLFTVTFTTPMPNANYSVAGAVYDATTNAYVFSLSAAPTAAAFYIRVTGLSASAGTASTSPTNADRISFAVFA